MNKLSDVLFRGTDERNSLRDVSESLLLDLDTSTRRDRYTRYAVLLALSTVIATGGVVTDSTATVIGAMIVAPLATPIMGLAFALVVASPARLSQSVMLLAVSVVGVVGLAVALAWVMPDVVDFAHNSQVLGRTSPRVTDLMVAIATGFVGAFAAIRKDLSSVLPGVAIAISLVPPLAVVGLAVHYRQWDDALGAFILFSSNVVAMVLAGISMFWVAGFRPSVLPSRATSMRRAYGTVALMMAVLLVPLGIS
ncbi:MAG TPA: TIGR00341 family protein, partial [Actinomycetes bacterium]|nr:TIGR00341 family protein [Actinomycetes bacterium]